MMQQNEKCSNSVIATPETNEKPLENKGKTPSAMNGTTVETLPQSTSSSPAASKATASPLQVTQSRTGLNFIQGLKLEAKDFTDKWYPATVLECDWTDREIFIHFDKWSSRYDEWIPMDSPRLRSLQAKQKDSSKGANKEFHVGEHISATWNDGKKYPAKVSAVLENDKYNVLFDDGFSKILKKSKMHKLIGKPLCASPISSTSMSSSNDYSNYIGTKEERREKKRKHNVTDLFHSKKRVKSSDSEKMHKKHDTCDSSMSSVPSDTKFDSSTCPKFSDDNSFLINMQGGPHTNEMKGFVTVTTEGTNARRYVIVPDTKIPEEWEKRLVQRRTGNSAGKWDVIFVNKITGKKFRSRGDIKTFMETQGLIDFDINLFDFCVQPNKSRNRTRSEGGVKKIKTLLPKLKSSATSTEVNPTVFHETQSTSYNANLNPEICGDNATFIGDLRVEIKDSSYKCPKDGCNKSFRKENLLQMHIKHYHPEYSKFVGCTPNVADLAYARTIGESVADIIPKKLKTSTHTSQTSRVNSPSAFQNVEDFNQSDFKENSVLLNDLKNDKNPEIHDNNISGEEFSLDRGSNCTMSPGTLFDLRNGGEDKVHTGIKTLPPVRPALMENHLRNQYFETNCNSKIKKQLKFEYNIEDHMSFSEDNSEYGFKNNSVKTELLNESSLENYKNLEESIFTENGQVIKVEKLKKEEIINCTCGFCEEDGLMIQCDLCLCWQHGYCNAIEKETDVPEKYICFICKNSHRQRFSKKYMQDQDWIKEGTLPRLEKDSYDLTAQNLRSAKLKRSYDLIGSLLEINNILHSLRVKINVAQNKNHPKLYLWAKNWSKVEIPEFDNVAVPVMEIIKNVDTELDNTINGTLSISEKFGMLSSSKSELDSKLITSDTELMKILEEEDNMEDSKVPLKSPISNSSLEDDRHLLLDALTQSNGDCYDGTSTPVKDKTNISDTLSNSLSTLKQINDNIDSHQEKKPINQPIIPQPEAPIDPLECKLRLLEHVNHCQNYIDFIMNYIDIQINSLEHDDFDEKVDPKTQLECKQTIKMLLNDLEAIRKIAALC